MWEQQQSDGIIILQIPENLDDSESIERTFSELPGLIQSDPQGRWLLDASGIGRISSLAIAQLIAAVRAVDMAGGRIVMSGAHPFVANVLRTTRIVKVLPLFETRDSALAYLHEA